RIDRDRRQRHGFSAGSGRQKMTQPWKEVTMRLRPGRLLMVSLASFTAALAVHCSDSGGVEQYIGGPQFVVEPPNPYGPMDPDTPVVVRVTLSVPNLRYSPHPWIATATATGGRTASYIYEWYDNFCGNGCSSTGPPYVGPTPMQVGTSNTFNMDHIPSYAERYRVTVRVHEDQSANYYSGVATIAGLGPAFS